MDIGDCTGIAADRAKSEGAACDFRDVLPQAAALAVAAWPLFLLACRISGSERTGCLWAVAYLFNPFLLNAVAWDFHPVTLAVPLVALALLAVDSGDGRLLVGCCLPCSSSRSRWGSRWRGSAPFTSPPWPTTCRCGPPSGVASAPGFHPFFGDKGMVVRIEPAFA
jgi:hypothetical protein